MKVSFLSENINLSNFGAGRDGELRVARVLRSLYFITEMKSLGSKTILGLAVPRVRSKNQNIFWLRLIL